MVDEDLFVVWYYSYVLRIDCKLVSIFTKEYKYWFLFLLRNISSEKKYWAQQAHRQDLHTV
jgi:hypothetical protein